MAFPAAILGCLVHPVAAVRAAMKAVIIALSRRRIMGELGQLDDRMLRDIGLTRNDVQSAMTEPLFRDPTIQLVARAHESRVASRAAARERVAMASLLRSWNDESRAA